LPTGARRRGKDAPGQRRKECSPRDHCIADRRQPRC
jgi:hypothetical protein